MVGNLEGKSQHGWEDNTKTAVKETGRQGIDWLHLAQVGTNEGFCVRGNGIYTFF
jgi:hypothetical protein